MCRLTLFLAALAITVFTFSCNEAMVRHCCGVLDVSDTTVVDGRELIDFCFVSSAASEPSDTLGVSLPLDYSRRLFFVLAASLFRVSTTFKCCHASAEVLTLVICSVFGDPLVKILSNLPCTEKIFVYWAGDVVCPGVRRQYGLKALGRGIPRA